MVLICCMLTRERESENKLKRREVVRENFILRGGNEIERHFIGRFPSASSRPSYGSTMKMYKRKTLEAAA